MTDWEEELGKGAVQAAALPAGYQGAIWIADWPVASAEIAGDIEPGKPAAACGRQGLLALNEWAREAGLKVGMSRRQAHAACPEAVLIAHSPEREAQRFEPVMRAIEAHVAAPRILEPGLVLFTARGPARTAGGLTELSEGLVGDIASMAGAEAHVGYGEGLLAPVLAARQEGAVEPGKSRSYLASFEAASLMLGVYSSELRIDAARCIRLLETLGIRQIGEVAELGEAAMVSRFAAAGELLWRLACAMDVPVEIRGSREADVEISRSFDPALENAQAAAFASRTLAEDMAAQMMRRSASAGRLTIEAHLENGKHLERSWMVEGGGAAGIVDRVRWQLAAWMGSDEDKAPISRLSLTMGEIQKAGMRPEPLWGGRSAGDELAGRAAVRIQSLLGEDAVLRAAEVGGRSPAEAVALRVWDEAEPESRKGQPWPGRIPDPAPARMARKPPEADIRCSCGQRLGVGADGDLLCPGGCREPSPSRADGQAVQAWAGPWIVEERWWEAQMRRRAYLQVDTDAGAFLMFIEKGVWHEEGAYA